jgi:hypothetical protein
MLPVAVRMKQRTAPQPAGCDMVPPAWRMMSQMSWHVCTLAETFG